MKLRYEVTLDDLVAFNHYHRERSPTVRRARAVVTWGFAVLILAFYTVLAVVLDQLWLILPGIALAIWLVLTRPGDARRALNRHVRRLLKEGSNKSLIGPHELELTENDLVERTPFGESRVRLQVIERVISEGSYTFIYLSAVSANVIPHHAVSEGDREAFVAAIQHRLSALPQEASA